MQDTYILPVHCLQLQVSSEVHVKVDLACHLLSVQFRGKLTLYSRIGWVNHQDKSHMIGGAGCPLFKGVHKAGYQFHCKLCAE